MILRAAVLAYVIGFSDTLFVFLLGPSKEKSMKMQHVLQHVIAHVFPPKKCGIVHTAGSKLDDDGRRDQTSKADERDASCLCNLNIICHSMIKQV